MNRGEKMMANNCCKDCNKECIKRIEQLEQLLYYLIANENNNRKIRLQMLNEFTDEIKKV